MNGIPYSKEDVDILNKYAGVKNTSEISIILGRSRYSVLQKAKLLKISLRQVGENHHKAKLSNLQVEMIRALAESGFTIREIHNAVFSETSIDTIRSIVTFWKRTA